MNILVTGANGQLGNEIRIITRESDDHYVFTDVNQVEGVETVFLDITDLEAVMPRGRKSTARRLPQRVRKSAGTLTKA